METKKYYKDKLTKILTYACITFFVATSVVVGILSETESSILPGFVVGIFFSGLPCGWSITSKVFGGMVFASLFGIFLLIVRLVLSLVIGVFALPVQILECVSKMRTAPDEPTFEE